MNEFAGERGVGRGNRGKEVRFRWAVADVPILCRRWSWFTFLGLLHRLVVERMEWSWLSFPLLGARQVASVTVVTLFLCGCSPLPATVSGQEITPPVPSADSRPRVVVLTDFFKDPDDKQSLIRFLCYANEFDVEGLIATSLAHGTGEVHPDWIIDVLDDYDQVVTRLRRHQPAGNEYPSADELKAKVKAGAAVRRKFRGGNQGFAVPYPTGAHDTRSCDPAEQWIGPGKDTEASQHLIKVIDRNDARPVWVVVWGGAMDLAQALWRVRQDRTPPETAEFVRRLRVYQISWQDTGSVWIWENFPELFLIHSSESMRGIYRQGEPALRNQFWVEEHLRKQHGVLGELYPRAGRVDGIKEGDSPSFLYLLAPGLSDPEHPEWGGWGGRFVPYGHDTRFFIDAEDDHPHSDDATDRKEWTVGRWTAARNHEFAARMDWCVQDPDSANHPPRLNLNGQSGTAILRRRTRPAQTVTLDAQGTTDPDGDRLSFRWWQYHEADSYSGRIRIENHKQPTAHFVAPQVEQETEIHVVLEVTDDGQPPLTAYRRLVVTIDPSDGR